MSRRERLEARAERRREWAAKRNAKAATVAVESARYRGDHAFNTQPGHIPERARLIAREERAFADVKMAAHHTAKAGGIEQQLERSIFSDDDNATEALEAKAADLDRIAERRKAVNAAFRKAPGADNAAKLAALVEAGTLTRNEAHSLALSMAACHWEKAPFPAYSISNTRANARRYRERIKAIAAQTARTDEAEAAGGVVVKYYGEPPEQAHVTFSEYPGREMVNTLKAAGFWWSRPSWIGQRDKMPAAVLEMVNV